MKNIHEKAVDDREELERQKMIELFNQMGITNYHLEEIGSKVRHDGNYTTSKGEEIIFETKVREISSTMYKTTIIETDKLAYLLAEAERQNKIPYIFIFFTDGVCFYDRLKPDVIYEGFNAEAKQSTYGYNKNVTLKSYAAFPIKSKQIIKLN